MTRTERLLIIGGSGREAGKSSLAALLISRYADRGITAIKITPHPHPGVTGLTLIAGNTEFQIYEERNSTSEKDSSRMLRAGASIVFLVVSGEAKLGEAFAALIPFLPENMPIICESPALRRLIIPDLFVLMLHSEGQNPERKNIDDLIPLADLHFTLRDLDHNKADIIDLDADNRWCLKP
jgi:hypothetical protein